MSAFDDALVAVMLADYIGVDAGGKYNVVGGGFQFTAIQPSGTTSPMFIATVVDLPKKYIGQKVALTIELFDLTDNSSVRMPSPSGRPEAIRAEQLIAVPPPNFAQPGFVPPDMGARLQVVMGFPNGIPLTPGRDYEWRVSVDQQRRKGWVARFTVLEPQAPIVLGGHAGPADIPNITIDPVAPDDDVVD